jgi:hypothetical protein
MIYKIKKKIKSLFDDTSSECFTLEKMRMKLIEDGYDVEPISINDIECMWLRVKIPNEENKSIRVTFESYHDDYYMRMLKEIYGK